MKFIELEDGDLVNADAITGIGIRMMEGSKKFPSLEDPDPADTWSVQVFIEALGGWFMVRDGLRTGSEARVLRNALRKELEG